MQEGMVAIQNAVNQMVLAARADATAANQKKNDDHLATLGRISDQREQENQQLKRLHQEREAQLKQQQDQINNLTQVCRQREEQLKQETANHNNIMAALQREKQDLAEENGKLKQQVAAQRQYQIQMANQQQYQIPMANQQQVVNANHQEGSQQNPIIIPDAGGVALQPQNAVYRNGGHLGAYRGYFY